MLYSGIGLHKRSLVIHTLDADEAVVREATLAGRREAVAAYCATPPGPHRARRRPLPLPPVSRAAALGGCPCAAVSCARVADPQARGS